MAGTARIFTMQTKSHQHVYSHLCLISKKHEVYYINSLLKLTPFSLVKTQCKVDIVHWYCHYFAHTRCLF